jgi:hypothetical protein
MKLVWKGEELTAIQVGETLGLDKVMVCGIEKFGETFAVTAKVINVQSMELDWSESVFVKTEDQIFETFKTMSSSLLTYYRASRSLAEASTAGEQEDRLKAAWVFLGAQGGDLEYLLERRLSTEEYLALRQYDISFLPRDYVQLKRQGADVNVVMSFMQAGISWELTRKAIGLGITRMDRYREGFASQSYTFAQYVEAFQNGLVTPEEYKAYRAGFRKDFITVGVGGIADSFPVSTAEVKFPLAEVGWERFWTANLRQAFKFSTTAGIYGMWLIVPVPFVSLNAYFGYYPYYAKLGISGQTELIIGGHTGVAATLGFELLERFQLDTFWVFAGTQPLVSYSHFEIRRGDPEYVRIHFPYIGVLFQYKL